MAIDLSEIKKQKEKVIGESWKTKLDRTLNTDISFGSGLNDKFKVQFYDTLYTLLNAGLDLISALDILIEEERQKKNKATLVKIKDSIINGKVLSEALIESKQFSSFEISSIAIGEETASLNDIFRELRSFFDKKIVMRRKLISAMTYPLFVTGVSVLVVFFMLRFLVPMFENLYVRIGGDLPPITKTLLNMSNAFQIGFKYFILFILIMFVAYFYSSKNATFRRKRDQLVMKLPFIGQWINDNYVLRFCTMEYMLLRAKTPLGRSLKLSSNTINYWPLHNSLNLAYDRLLEGKSFYESIQAENVFDHRFKAMIKVGEQVNQLELMFKRYQEQLEAKIEEKNKAFYSIMEPLVITILGLVVGFILIALYLPIFNISQNLGS